MASSVVDAIKGKKGGTDKDSEKGDRESVNLENERDA